MTQCREVQAKLIDLISSNLTPSEVQVLQDHLAECPQCAREKQEIERIWDGLSHLEETVVPVGLREQTMNRVLAKASRKGRWERLMPQRVRHALTASVLGILMILLYGWILMRRVSLDRLSPGDLIILVTLWSGLLIAAFGILLSGYRTRAINLRGAIAIGILATGVTMVGAFFCPEATFFQWWLGSSLGMKMTAEIGNAGSHFIFGIVYGFLPAILAATALGSQCRGKLSQHALAVACIFVVLMLPAAYLQCAYLSVWVIMIGFSFGALSGAIAGAFAGLGITRRRLGKFFLLLMLGLLFVSSCSSDTEVLSEETAMKPDDVETPPGMTDEPQEGTLISDRPLIDDPQDRPSEQVALLFPEFFPKGVKHTIPLKQIRHGGPPKDGIPALTRPDTLPALLADYLKEDDRVLGLSIQDESRAYPIRILNWHEIVNDTLGGTPAVITFCPLCGTGIAFEAEMDGTLSEFGVSGMLYNSDLLMYDRYTDTPSLWAQALGEAVVGPKTGTKLKLLPLTQTTWGAWRNAHPQTTVLSANTGFGRDYGRDPYSGYAQNPGLFFPVEREDGRLNPKDLVLGVRLQNITRAYPLKILQASQVVNDHLGGQSLVLIAQPDTEAVRMYLTQGQQFIGNAGKLVEQATQQPWELMEEALLNPRTGESLRRHRDAFVSFWFAWFTFYPDTELYE